jgi:hypothetical protein
MTVPLNPSNGFSFDRPDRYWSIDASIPPAASIEPSTYAPLQAKPVFGEDDGLQPIGSFAYSMAPAMDGDCSG